MNWRRVPLPWLAFGGVVLCAWCSTLSAVGGWVAGRDMAQRETLSAVATAQTAAFLPPLGVIVTRVESTAPAARAGIRRGDVVVALNDVAVDDVPGLRVSINMFRPGDTVRIRVLRGRDDQPLEFDVQLAPFPNDAMVAYLGLYYTARAEDPADI